MPLADQNSSTGPLAQTQHQLEAFKGRKRHQHRHRPRDESGERVVSAGDLGSECCSYEQVYQRIIEMLNATTHQAKDLELSRAIMEELQVSV